MIRINLLDQPGTLRRGPAAGPGRREARAAVAMFLIAAGALGGWRWQVGRQLALVDNRIARAERDLARSNDAAKAADLARVRKTRLSERLSLIGRIRVAQRDPASLLAIVSQSLTDGLWLLELVQRNGLVEIDGRAMSLNAVIEFVEHLQTSGHFEGAVKIVTTSTESQEEVPVVKFSIRAQTRGNSLSADGGAPGSGSSAIRRGA
jgi:Tfp pilus assembly protein PilN